MTSRTAAATLVLAVPFHNEESHLPRLFRALRAQSPGLPVLFVDNASVDGSAALVRACPEVGDGLWTCLAEPRVGKFHAMRTATAHARRRWGARYLAFLDADSYPADAAWSRRSLEIVEAARGGFGYSYSQVRYFGFAELPRFRAAYSAYDVTLWGLVDQLGWHASGPGFVCDAALFERYLREAEVTTEIDLRYSLWALREGQRGYLNATALFSSARRIVANDATLAAWCFYEPDFYAKKDINAIEKLDLAAPSRARDLPPDAAQRLFERRALKLASRQVLPLACFDSSGTFARACRAAFGLSLGGDFERATARFRQSPDWLLTQRFEGMLREFAALPVTAMLAGRIAALMRERYAQGRRSP